MAEIYRKITIEIKSTEDNIEQDFDHLVDSIRNGNYCGAAKCGNDYYEFEIRDVNSGSLKGILS